MDRVGSDGADTEDCTEQVGPAPQMLLGTQKLTGRMLLLHRIVRGRSALDDDLSGLHLKGLRAPRGKRDSARDNEGCTDVLGDDRLVGLLPQHLLIEDHLQVLKAGSVVQDDKSKVLHITDGANPSRTGDILLGERLFILIELIDPRTLQENLPAAKTDYPRCLSFGNRKIVKVEVSAKLIVCAPIGRKT